jgi:hypothetical protein
MSVPDNFRSQREEKKTGMRPTKRRHASHLKVYQKLASFFSVPPSPYFFFFFFLPVAEV